MALSSKMMMTTSAPPSPLAPWILETERLEKFQVSCDSSRFYNLGKFTWVVAHVDQRRVG